MKGNEGKALRLNQMKGNKGQETALRHNAQAPSSVPFESIHLLQGTIKVTKTVHSRDLKLKNAHYSLKLLNIAQYVFLI